MTPQTARVLREEPTVEPLPLAPSPSAPLHSWRWRGLDRSVRRWPALGRAGDAVCAGSMAVALHVRTIGGVVARRGRAALKTHAPKTYDRIAAFVGGIRSMTLRLNEQAKPLIAGGKASLRAGLDNLFLQGDLEFAPPRLGWERRRPPLQAYALILSVFAFFVVGLLWANWAILDEVTSGEGRVIPSSQIQVVQNLEGGIVKDILVHEGDIVNQDQVLLNIDNSAFVASFGEMRAKYFGLMAAVARLVAETQQSAPVFPPELLAEEPKIAQGEQALFLARQSELQAQLSVLGQQLQQREQELTELKNKHEHLQQSVSLVKKEIAINAPLVRNGVVPEVEAIKLERQLNDLSGDMQAAGLAIPRAESAVREVNKRIEEKYLTFRSDAQKELAQRQTELKTISESITAARDRVERTEVRSPVHGIVKQVKVATIGGVVKPGMDLVEIVPLDDTLLVEAKVRPRDIAFIKPNQDAIVKVTAYDFAIYGGLKAKVERISADAIEDDQRSQRPETYYKIVVRTDRNHLGSPQEPLPIIPGMVASVDILTGKKSVLDYLLKPILRGREKAMHER
jgi:membrane fusion protein, adhesin transport system